MRPIYGILLTLLFAPLLLIAIVLGGLVAPAFLHPIRRALTPDLVQQAQISFAHVGARPQVF